MGGINVKYKELLSLAVEQAFYQNKTCPKFTTLPRPDFRIIPTAECLELMKRMDLVFRPTDENGGFLILTAVFGKNGGGDDLIRFPPRRGDKLSFWMVCTNPSVFNFDQLPATIAASSMFYFSNQVTDLAALRDDLHISSGSAGVDATNDAVKKSAANYSYHHNAVLIGADTVVKHTLTGNEISARAVVNEGGASTLYFDLSLLPPGQCKLFINHIETDAFYYMGAVVPQPVFGVIELSLSDLLDANYRVVEADRSLTTQRPLFKILFPNRSTFWRYTVQLEESSALYIEMNALAGPDKTDFINRINIISNDANIKFQQISASDTTFEFVSLNEIPLQEKYISSSGMNHDTLSLELKKYIGNLAKEAAVKSNLPCPSSGSIDASNDPVIYSDIFLTI